MLVLQSIWQIFYYHLNRTQSVLCRGTDGQVGTEIEDFPTAGMGMSSIEWWSGTYFETFSEDLSQEVSGPSRRKLKMCGGVYINFLKGTVYRTKSGLAHPSVSSRLTAQSYLVQCPKWWLLLHPVDTRPTPVSCHGKGTFVSFSWVRENPHNGPTQQLLFSWCKIKQLVLGCETQNGSLYLVLPHFFPPKAFSSALEHLHPAHLCSTWCKGTSPRWHAMGLQSCWPNIDGHLVSGSHHWCALHSIMLSTGTGTALPIQDNQVIRAQT